MLQIAHLSFASPLVLAPLAGYSDLPFRLLCKRYGAGYCVSEMISCHGLSYGQQNTLKLLSSVQQERPVSFQLFGADPEVMADAAEVLATHSPEMIDINMGCPVKKVTKRGAGAALMTNRKLAENILNKIVSRVSIPVTVKIRSGKDADSITAGTFAKMAEDQGVAAITVHARTWAQGFSGKIDPAVIAEVKKTVNIPVIGNGDVLSYQDARQMMAETGCDGVMIGRGALGNPWIFKETGRPENLSEIVAGAREHLRLIEQFLPADRLLGHVKSQISRYFKGLPGSSTVRMKIFAANNLQSLREIIDFYAGLF
ncbi:MAG: tRNA dihydrouridine synthase DusB [Proteobacteria bacterium]|nr:tRNA dihydrouridine synthase DusB [Pseudomonadota bacterium]